MPGRVGADLCALSRDRGHSERSGRTGRPRGDTVIEVCERHPDGTVTVLSRHEYHAR